MSLIDKLVDNTRKETYVVNISNIVEGYVENSSNIFSKNNLSVKLQIPNIDKKIFEETMAVANASIDTKSAHYQDGKRQVISFKDEEWKDTVIDPFLSVSNYGRVIDKMTGELLNEKPNQEGYLTVTIRGKRHSIHRLVIEAFNPIPAEIRNQFVPDHINRIKSDNRLCNLRWATNSENASNINSNPYNIIEDYLEKNELDFIFRKLAKMIDDEVHSRPAQSYSSLYEEFSSKFPTSDKTGDFTQFKKCISRFKTGSRRRIEFIGYLKEYGLQNIFNKRDKNVIINNTSIPFKTKKQKERERVERICQILDNKPSGFTARDVARELGELERFETDRKFRSSFNSKISDIRNKKIFADISSKYNIGRVTLPDQTVYTICRWIDEGYRNEEIIDKLGITDKAERERYQCRLSLIRSGQILTKISKNFNFVKNKINNN